ncbi:hypothetical protein CIPAW_01G207200 [Carya illinoinensis]|uniref:Uncharacterized protein n=1 Tax=Carya illinoinensis TaxID=32201 RepID=A0A8T1RQC9_CARIL|nr:hypothetical protein CIPAW_01G207200 [Carya illinoinensis]
MENQIIIIQAVKMMCKCQKKLESGALTHSFGPAVFSKSRTYDFSPTLLVLWSKVVRN